MISRVEPVSGSGAKGSGQGQSKPSDKTDLITRLGGKRKAMNEDNQEPEQDRAHQQAVSSGKSFLDAVVEQGGGASESGRRCRSEQEDETRGTILEFGDRTRLFFYRVEIINCKLCCSLRVAV